MYTKPNYPSDNKPRRRLQAVPTMSQNIRRRAASPGQQMQGGAGLLGTPPEAGGVPQRRLPGASSLAPGQIKAPGTSARQWAPGQQGGVWGQSPGGRPSPGSVGTEGQQEFWGANPNQIMGQPESQRGDPRDNLN